MNLTFSAEFYPCGMPDPVPGRAGILALEAAMHALPDELKGDCEEHTTHHFAPGLYARQFDLKAGEVLIGKIHKFDHLAMLVCGEMAIADEFGVQRVKGPLLFNSKRGAKRAGYALTDATFITFHPTDETDVAKIEEQVIAPSFEALDQFLLEDAKCRGAE